MMLTVINACIVGVVWLGFLLAAAEVVRGRRKKAPQAKPDPEPHFGPSRHAPGAELR
jgi:hypothetical protein